MRKTLIQRKEVGAGGAASIEFTSIPQTYTDLFVVFTGRSARVSPTTDDVVFQLNSDATNQSTRWLWGSGSGVLSQTDTQPLIGEYPTSTYTANTFGSYQVYIPNYTSSNAKSFSADGVGENNATAAYQVIAAGLYNSTDAITSILIKTGSGSNLEQYSSASLYGVSKYNVSSGSPKATGGIISYDSATDKWVHVFAASGTFTPSENLTAEYLVVAGGGGGGNNGSGFGGGGGAGGYRCSVSGESSGGGASAETPLSLTASTGYTVTVGAGGTIDGSGNNSVFSTITSTGGGRGGGSSSAAVGGSGGGGRESLSGAAGTTNQGFGGGNGVGGATAGGGGGGGASQVGENAAVGAGAGNGGNGVASSITGTSITRAGGGGGGSDGGDPSIGGTGGGGAGADLPSTASVSGAVGTGSGGGGGVTSLNGSAGGSGIVIVRYSA